MMIFCKRNFLLLPVLLAAGCATKTKQPEPIRPLLPPAIEAPCPAPKTTVEKVKTVPKKKVEPVKKTPVKKTPVKEAITPVVEKKPVIQPETKIIPSKNIPTPKPELQSRRTPDAVTPEGFRRGAGLWQAFARLSPKEQQSLMKLQRKEPDKFRMIMQQKVDQLYAQERARRKELENLVQKYRNTQDENQKEAVKKELREKLRIDFKQRLQNSRRDLESNRKRLNHMESELVKREKNQNAIVDAMLRKMIAVPKTL